MVRDANELRWKFLRRSALDPMLLAAAVFGGAGTFHFWQGWVLFGVQLAGLSVCSLYMYRRDPELLRRRSLHKENRLAQKILILFWRLIIGTSLVLAGCDSRFGWTRAFFGPVPLSVECFSFAMVAVGHVLFLQVLRANSFAASVIQLHDAQTVATSGPYRFVRHPMYLSFILTTVFATLGLGSVVATAVALLIIPVIALRLLNEEALLRRDLSGYAEYCARTTSRILPYIW